MAIVYVQSNSAYSTSSVSYVSATLTATPSVGNFIIVQVSGVGVGTVHSLSDNKGNTYHRIGLTQQAYVNAFAEKGYYTFFYAIISATSSSFTLTGASNLQGAMAIIAHVYSGVDASTPVDTFVLRPSTSGSNASDSITPANPGSLIYLGLYQDITGGPTSSVYSPFTIRQNTTSSGYDGSSIASADYIQPIAGAISGTWGNSSSYQTASIIALKPAGIIPANTSGLLAMF